MLNSPFAQTGAARAINKGLLKNSKFSFNGIINNLEKTVSTINQVVPLYNQVRPLITNSKTIINAFRSTKGNTTNKKQTKRNNQFSNKNFDPNIINVEVNPSTLNAPINQQETQKNDYLFTSIDSPDKPFFN